MPRSQNEVRISVPASDARRASCTNGTGIIERTEQGWLHLTFNINI
ncbi:hypothetical protein [Caballeronia sp. GAWG1-1]|nr:hypothetical protein [Caballeronia sp. GAWG1-1]